MASIYLFICLLTGGPTGVPQACMSADNLEELVLSFQHVGPGNQTEVLELGGKSLYLLTPLPCPTASFEKHG